nr:PDDEXK nuclease domain-containing protein [Sphingobacterium faecale]
MNIYVRIFDEIKRKQDDNPTIGLLLCTEIDRTVLK